MMLAFAMVASYNKIVFACHNIFHCLLHFYFFYSFFNVSSFVQQMAAFTARCQPFSNSLACSGFIDGVKARSSCH